MLCDYQEEEKKDIDKEKDQKKEADNKVEKDKDTTTIATLGAADKPQDSVTATTMTKDKSKEKETSSMLLSSSEKKDVEGEKKETAEPTFEMLSNPARVMRVQVGSCFLLLLLWQACLATLICEAKCPEGISTSFPLT